MLHKIKWIFAASLLTSSFAFADRMGQDGDKFYEEAARFEHACKATPECEAPYSRKIVYSQKTRFDKMPLDIRNELKRVAFAQAQIWGDTILEGDYHAAGRTRLDVVEAFYKNDAIVGYKIIYSEKAWFVGNCEFHGTQDSLKNCKQGRITEGSFVSPDAQTYFTDEEKYAEFSFVLN